MLTVERYCPAGGQISYHLRLQSVRLTDAEIDERRVLQEASVIGIIPVDLNPHATQPLRCRQVNCVERFEAPTSGDSVAHQVSSDLTNAYVVFN